MERPDGGARGRGPPVGELDLQTRLRQSDGLEHKAALPSRWDGTRHEGDEAGDREPGPGKRQGRKLTNKEKMIFPEIVGISYGYIGPRSSCFIMLVEFEKWVGESIRMRYHQICDDGVSRCIFDLRLPV